MSLTTIIQKLLRGAVLSAALYSCGGSSETPECQDDYDCSEQEVCVEGECLDGCSRDSNTEREFLDLEGTILFQSINDTSNDIYSLDTATRRQSNLINTLPPNDESDPIVSPDRTAIIFRSCNKVCDIYLMDINGNNQRNITNSLEGTSFSPTGGVWSPGATKITFSVYRSNPPASDIYILDLSSSSYTQLTDNPSDLSISDEGAAWSPDGTSIVFHSRTDEYVDIYTIGAQGDNQQNLTNNFSPKAFNPSWSPDGSKIIFYTYQDKYATDIYSMYRDGSNIRNLTNNGRYNVRPYWSPEGSRIAFVSALDSKNFTANSNEIYLMDADGSNQHQLVHNGLTKFDLTWSPDGRKIAFDDGYLDFGIQNIYVVDTNNCATEQLTRGSNYDPFWYGDF